MARQRLPAHAAAAPPSLVPRTCTHALPLLRRQGNALFSKGRFLAAADLYTEAITLVPGERAYASLYINRAMCYKKAGGPRWAHQVVQDAGSALALDGGLMKANYLMGVAQRQLQQHAAAVRHLTKALEAAREQGDAIKDEM